LGGNRLGLPATLCRGLEELNERELTSSTGQGPLTRPADRSGQPSESHELEEPQANASTRQLLINSLTGYGAMIIALLMGFALTPITLHRLGTSVYGLWVVLTAIGGYVGVVEGGVSTAAAQMVAATTALRDYQRRADVLATTRAIFFVTGIIALGLVLAMVPLLGPVFGTGAESLNSARLALLLVGFTTTIGFFGTVYQCAIYGGGRNDRTTVFGTATGLLVQGAQIAVVLLGGGLAGLLATSLAGSVLTYFWARWIARNLGLYGKVRGKTSRSMLHELLTFGRRNAVVALGGTLAYSLDAVIVGAVLPVGQVTPYDLGLSTANFVRSAGTTATNLLFPAYAHSHALNDRERQFRLFSRAVLASMSITLPMVVGLIAFGQPLLKLWLGSVPPHTFQVLVALNVVYVLQLPGHQSFMYLTGIAKNRVLAKLALPAAAANFALSIGATYWLGPVGPAIGSLPQVAILDFLVLPGMACKALGASRRRYVKEAMLPVVVPTVAAIAAALALHALMGAHPAGFWAPGGAVIVSLLAWAALLPVLLKTDPVVGDLVRRGQVKLLASVKR
jgi:O-antigen/teichoic acid export membrane protein